MDDVTREAIDELRVMENRWCNSVSTRDQTMSAIVRAACDREQLGSSGDGYIETRCGEGGCTLTRGHISTHWQAGASPEPTDTRALRERLIVALAPAVWTNRSSFASDGRAINSAVAFADAIVSAAGAKP